MNDNDGNPFDDDFDDALHRLTDQGVSPEQAREIMRDAWSKINKRLAPGYGTLEGNRDMLDGSRSSLPVTANEEATARAQRFGQLVVELSQMPPREFDRAVTHYFGDQVAFEKQLREFEEIHDEEFLRGLTNEAAAQARRAEDTAEIADIRAGKTSTTWSPGHRKPVKEDV